MIGFWEFRISMMGMIRWGQYCERGCAMGITSCLVTLLSQNSLSKKQMISAIGESYWRC